MLSLRGAPPMTVMRTRLGIAIVCVLLGLGAGVRGQSALGTAFTYQGRLTDAGAAATGPYDFQFKLFDAATSGNAVGSAVSASSVAVASGVFTVSLDFGPVAFTGNARWLEVGVRPAGASGAFTILTPRQALAPAPYALYAKYALSATSAVDASSADNAFQLAGKPASFYLNLTNQTGTLSVAQGGTGATSVAASPFLTKTIDACAAGSSLQAINSDGTVLCQAAAPGRNVSLAMLDKAGDVGSHTSVTIGTDGLGLISYYDTTMKHLKVAHCANAACSSATSASIDNTGSQVGQYSSITIGADGRGLVSYFDFTNGRLKVAHCTNAACSSATVATLDSGDLGEFTSVTIGADGLGLISYFDFLHLKVAHCADVACSGAAPAPAIVDTAFVVGASTSIAIGSDGLGLISYLDITRNDLKVAHCTDAACSSATSAPVDSTGSVGFYTSITIGTDGLGLISYYDATNSALKVAHCTSVACSSVTSVILDNAGGVGASASARTSIAIGTDGLGLISYYDAASGHLKVAHCATVACASATSATLDSAGDVGQYSSITIGADGLGLVSYYDATNKTLRVAHCGNTACTPFVVGRR
jgi:hypothetical protein